MVTLAQRIEALREEAGLSRSELNAALALPKGAIEKFETGRQTPTKAQQEKLSGYFGVSLFYLRGESGDRTRQEDWMNASSDPPAPARPPKAQVYEPPKPDQPTVWDTLLAGKQTRELLRSVVLDTLRSPEGQAIIAKAIEKREHDISKARADNPSVGSGVLASD